MNVEVDFGAGPRRLAGSTRVLDLRPGSDGLVSAEGPVDWSQLDALPQCLTVEWSGPERGIIAAVAARRGIRFLYWYDAIGDIDLRSTSLGTVRFEGAGLRSVRLPDSIETLLLRRPPAALQVDAPDMGHRLDLRLFQYGPDVVIPDGVRRTPKVWLWVGGEVSAAVLAGLTSLRHLFLNGTRRTIAAALKARFTGSTVMVSVKGAKSQAWLAAHMDNPFRDWVEDSKAFGQAACSAYTRARRAIEAIAPEAPDRLDAAERALRGLVADLSSINDEHGLIDTIHREHAWVVFRRLAKRLQVPEPEADRWFDDGRRF